MYIYRLVLVLVIGVYYFFPVIVNWWMLQRSNWYQIYILWLILIMVIFILQFTN